MHKWRHPKATPNDGVRSDLQNFRDLIKFSQTKNVWHIHGVHSLTFGYF